MSLIVTAQPVSEPVTVDEVKKRLRLSSAVDDTTIVSLITTAREHAESITGWSMAAKSYREVRDRFPWPGEVIRLLRPPLLTVVSVQYLDDNYDWQTWDASEYRVAEANVPAVIEPKKGFIYPAPVRASGSVKIDFTADAFDYSPYREGIRQLAVHLYEHPSAITSEGLKEIPFAITAIFMAKKIFGF